jgi:hypothetical protein
MIWACEAIKHFVYASEKERIQKIAIVITFSQFGLKLRENATEMDPVVQICSDQRDGLPAVGLKSSMNDWRLILEALPKLVTKSLFARGQWRQTIRSNIFGIHIDRQPIELGFIH